MCTVFLIYFYDMTSTLSRFLLLYTDSTLMTIGPRGHPSLAPLYSVFSNSGTNTTAVLCCQSLQYDQQNEQSREGSVYSCSVICPFYCVCRVWSIHVMRKQTCHFFFLIFCACPARVLPRIRHPLIPGTVLVRREDSAGEGQSDYNIAPPIVRSSFLVHVTVVSK